MHCHSLHTGMTVRRACVVLQYVTELSVLKYRLLKKSVHKSSSVESYINLVAHKIQQMLIFFTPCILIQLSNVYQRNAHFSNLCINSIFGVLYLYMFRTLWVHHQEDSLFMQFCMVSFLCIYVNNLLT